MFPFKCSFVEWTDVTFFFNFNYFSTRPQFGTDIYFLTNPKQTTHPSCQRRLAAQTAIFECSFNVFVLLLREQLMHLLVFSVWFRVHQYHEHKDWGSCFPGWDRKEKRFTLLLEDFDNLYSNLLCGRILLFWTEFELCPIVKPGPYFQGKVLLITTDSTFNSMIHWSVFKGQF